MAWFEYRPARPFDFAMIQSTLPDHRTQPSWSAFRVAAFACFLACVATVVALAALPASAAASTASWSFQPAAFDFGTRHPESGPSAPQAFTLTNTGEASLTPVFISLSSEAGSGFELAGNNCGALAPGASCEVNVTFDPPTAGRKEATLAVSEMNSKAAPAVATVTGAGDGPVVTVDPPSIDFGTLRFGSAPPAPRFVTVRNEGPMDLLISSVSFGEMAAPVASPTSPATFQLAGGSCEAGSMLPPAGICTVGIAYAPTAPGYGYAKLLIADDAVNSPQSVGIRGGASDTPDFQPTFPPPASPRALLWVYPEKRTESRRATFRFTGNSTAVRFQCRLGGRRFRACTSPVRYHQLDLGSHSFAVRALDSSGRIGHGRIYRWAIIR